MAILCDMSETLMIYLDYIPNFKVLCKEILKLSSLKDRQRWFRVHANLDLHFL